MTTEELNIRTERGLEELRRQFADRIPEARIIELGWANFHRLKATATIDEFVPLLVHRETREQLAAIEQGQLRPAA